MARSAYAALTVIVLTSSSACAQDAQPRAVLIGHKDEVSDVVFSPDGKTLASVGNSDETLRLWDTATGAERAVFSKKSQIGHVAFSPDGKTLAAISYYFYCFAGLTRYNNI
jgi:WD40 repeat protein